MPHLPLNKRNFGLDAVRALAIMLVVLSHSRAILSRSFAGAGDIFVLGYLGVEIFFVLSGFLIGGILINEIGPGSKLSDVRNFWKRRWWRTVPAYLAWLSVEFCLAIAASGLSVVLLLPKYLIFAQTLIWPVPPYPFNVSWSLAVEEWFYLLFPLIALVACKLKRSSSSGLIAACAAIIIVPTLLRLFYAIALDAPWGPSIRNATIVRLDAIAYGVLAAIFLKRMPEHWERYKLRFAVVGVSLLVFSCAYVQIVDRQSDLFARTFLFSLVSLGTALCLPAIRSMRRPQSTWLNAAVLYMSLWSYSAYLCHWTIRRGLLIINAKIFDLGFGSIASSMAAWAAYFLITVAISALSYYTIELWGLRMRDRFSRREVLLV